MLAVGGRLSRLPPKRSTYEKKGEGESEERKAEKQFIRQREEHRAKLAQEKEEAREAFEEAPPKFTPYKPKKAEVVEEIPDSDYTVGDILGAKAKVSQGHKGSVKVTLPPIRKPLEDPDEIEEL